MIKAGNSLYARLVVRMAAVLAASAALLIAAIWLSTSIAVDEAYDRLLTGSALQIAENTWYENGQVNVDVPLAAFAMLSPGDRVLYNVIGPGGRSVAGDPDFRPDIPWNELASGPILKDGEYQDLPIRIAIIGRAMPVKSGNRWAAIVMAQSRNARSAFLHGFVAKVLVVILVTGAFDPYPFVFLNLILSMLAAIQAPIIMMSQNRQAERDRFEAAKDYEVNLKAELEVLSLHQKIDMRVLTELTALREDVARLTAELAARR